MLFRLGDSTESFLVVALSNGSLVFADGLLQKTKGLPCYPLSTVPNQVGSGAAKQSTDEVTDSTKGIASATARSTWSAGSLTATTRWFGSTATGWFGTTSWDANPTGQSDSLVELLALTYKVFV